MKVESTKDEINHESPNIANAVLADVRSNKKGLKERIFDWVKEHSNEYVELKHIKQTNISLRDNATNREAYYFSCGGWTSHYTMKRWVEIAENKLYDSWHHKHGTWYWMKDNAIIS